MKESEKNVRFSIEKRTFFKTRVFQWKTGHIS